MLKRMIEAVQNAMKNVFTKSNKETIMKVARPKLTQYGTAAIFKQAYVRAVMFGK